LPAASVLVPRPVGLWRLSANVTLADLIPKAFSSFTCPEISPVWALVVEKRDISGKLSESGLNADLGMKGGMMLLRGVKHDRLVESYDC